jgi:acetyl esterase/lipase
VVILILCGRYINRPAVNGGMVTLSYVPFDNSEFHKLDLYIPAAGKQPHPCIVWVHGGGWSIGSKEDTPATYFVANDFAVASVNYRLTDRAIFPAQIEDCKAAVRYLRAHAKEYNIDANHIGAFGMSAGGHLVAMLGTTSSTGALEGKLGNLEQSSKVQAVCDWCGPTDLLTITDQAGPNNTLSLDTETGPLAKFLGGLPKNRTQLAKEASPVSYVSRDIPPFLLMHGTADDVVPIEQSQELYKLLKAAGVDCQFIPVKGGAHNFVTVQNLAIVREFFDKYLRSK